MIDRTLHTYHFIYDRLMMISSFRTCQTLQDIHKLNITLQKDYNYFLFRADGELRADDFQFCFVL